MTKARKAREKAQQEPDKAYQMWMVPAGKDMEFGGRLLRVESQIDFLRTVLLSLVDQVNQLSRIENFLIRDEKATLASLKVKADETERQQ